MTASQALRHAIDQFNRAYWYLEGADMDGKFCKIHGWVAVNYDCEGCNLCEDSRR